MKNNCYAIMSAILLFTTFNSACLSSDNYTPITSRRNLFKTALVGLAIMSMPKPVESAAPINSFIGCYVGTINPEDEPNMNAINIKTIKSVPCNFYYNYTPSQFKSIDMTISISCNKYNPDIACTNILINTINFCSANFITYNGYGQTISARLIWDYLNTKQYEKFALNIIDADLSSYRYYYPPTPASYRPNPPPTPNPENYYFSNIFANFMNTGKCPLPLISTSGN